MMRGLNRRAVGVAAAALSASMAHAQSPKCEKTWAASEAQKVFAVGARDCVRAKASKMAKGKDSASDVAIAAIDACSREIGLVNDGCYGADALQEALTDRLRRDAVRVVVETRTN